MFWWQILLLIIFLAIPVISENIQLNFLSNLMKFNVISPISTVIFFHDCHTNREKFEIYKRFDKRLIKFIESVDVVNDPELTLIVGSFSCIKFYKIIETLNKRFYRYPYRWLIFDLNSTYNGFIESLPITIDTQLIIIDTDDQDFVRIKGIYKINDSSKGIYEPIGYWNGSDNFVDQRAKPLLLSRRRNLQKRPMTASLVITVNDSINHLDDYRNIQVDMATKINYKITTVIFEYLNVTENYIYTNTWGYQNRTTKKWSGMIQDFLDGNAEVSGTAKFFSVDRINVMDYILKTIPTKVRFIFRPPSLSSVSNIYYYPFTGLVWICSFLLVFCCLLVFYMTYRYSKLNTGPIKGSDIILFGVGVICQMGSHIEPRNYSGRISMIFFLIYLLFLYTSYSANIVALLQSSSNSIRTVKNLIDSKLDIGVDETPYNRVLMPLASGSDPIRKRFYDQKINRPGVFVNTSTGIANVRKGFYAFNVATSIGYQLIIDTFYEHEKCNLAEISYIKASDPGYVIAKNSPYKKLIRIGLVKILECGIMNRELSIIDRKPPKCSGSGQVFTSVRLNDCTAVFLVFVYGMTLSLVIFLLEKLLAAYPIKNQIDDITSHG